MLLLKHFFVPDLSFFADAGLSHQPVSLYFFFSVAYVSLFYMSVLCCRIVLSLFVLDSWLHSLCLLSFAHVSIHSILPPFLWIFSPSPSCVCSENTYWGFSSPNCQALIAVCPFGTHNSHSAVSPRQMVGLMACQCFKSGWKFKIYTFKATTRGFIFSESILSCLSRSVHRWSSLLFTSQVSRLSHQICLPFFIKADIYGDALQYFWLPFMGFGTFSQCWCICLRRCQLNGIGNKLFINSNTCLPLQISTEH